MSSRASSSAGTAAAGKGGSSARTTVTDQLCQSIESTYNLLNLMQQSSHSRGQLMKLPKNLLDNTSMVKNSGQVLQQMPRIISSLDAYQENGLQSASHLSMVIQLLGNIESMKIINAVSDGHSQDEEPPAANVIN